MFHGTYDGVLVTLSVLVAAMASFAALNLAQQVTSAAGRARLAWLASGAVVMGLGIWSMHFVGMLAFRLPVRVGYAVGPLLLSIGAAVAASLLALLVASRPVLGAGRLAAAGALMGAAICGMHYIGMASMVMPARIDYDGRVVALSVLIAVAASVVALWLAYRLRLGPGGSEGALKSLSAAVMGLAIAGMHYTGMSAARFTPAAAHAAPGASVLATPQLGEAVAAGALAMIALAIVGTVIDRKVLRARLAYATTLAEQAEELRVQGAALGAQTEELAERTIELQVSNDELRTANVRLEAQVEVVERARRDAERAEQAEHEANQARIRFLNMVSHELRTPIGAIGGYVDLLLMGLRGELTAAQRTDLERVRANQEHVLRLLNELLDLAKLEAGQMVMHLRECGLREILAAANPMIEPQLLEKRIDFEQEIDGSMPRVECDEERARQIVINLLSNAIKFTPQGRKIRATAAYRAGHVEMRVSDSGPGVPGNRRAELFTPFAQLGVLGERAGGTGLGLAISRELARAMGGDLRLEDGDGGGATFVLELPAARQPVA